jgi:NodT family efflux transporter outer membrane factor (OMF) lipoprotein
MHGLCVWKRPTWHAPIKARRAARIARVVPALLAVSTLQGGCALSIADPPPAGLDIPATYQGAAGKAGVQPAPDWWRSFRSAELSALVERAIAANYDIAAAVARIEQADAQVRIVGAQLLPAGGLTGLRSASRESGAAIGLNRRLPDTRLHRVSLSASYEIDFWGKNAVLVRAAERTALASRFNRDVVELAVVTGVVTTYFEVLAAQDRLRIAHDNLRLAQRVQGIIQQRLDAGTSTTVDLLQQDFVVVQQRAAIPRLTNVLRQNIFALATLTGEIPARVSVRGGSLDRLNPPQVAPALPSELLLQRPDIREAELRLAAAAANLASARVALLPSIEITGERGYASTMLQTLFTPQAALYSVAASVTQPIFDAPRLLAQIDLQKAAQQELLERYRQTIIAGFTDVERALVDIRESANEERLAAEAVAVARRGYEISERQLDAGGIELTTMLNTQRTLFESLDALAQVRLARFRAITSLYRALGGGWKFDRSLHEQRADDRLLRQQPDVTKG